MPVMDVPRNTHDYSTRDGYQFAFYCDLCRREYKCTFIPSQAAKNARTAKVAGEFLGGSLGWMVRKQGDGDAVSTKQRTEKDEAYARSWAEVQKHFRKCPRDHMWACFECWNQETNLCTRCSPRLGVEMAAEQSQAAVHQMRQKVHQTQQFQGDAQSKVGSQCPSCGQYVTGGGKFCNFCGAMLAQPGCATCGFQNAPTAKFCGGCGATLR